MKSRSQIRIWGFILAIFLCGGWVGTDAMAQTITLKGASQFADDHSYNQTMLKFAEMVQKYYGKPVNFVLHRNRELGLEKDYFSYMSQGLSVDYAVVAPSHMATFSKMATLMDMPFLFRDIDHWSKTLASGETLAPIAEDVLKKADVMLIGYAGGVYGISLGKSRYATWPRSRTFPSGSWALRFRPVCSRP